MFARALVMVSVPINTLLLRNVKQCFPCRYMAGHSKWANIKHIKALKDGQRSAEFLKLAQKIRVAIQEGRSANPNSNLQLSQAIETAKRRDMPVGKIDAILKNAQNAPNVVGKSSIIELRGPGGCWILISIHSSNINTTKANLVQYFRKVSATVSEGGAKYCFEHKGVIEATIKDGNLEKCLEHAIEAGAEDVTWKEEEKFYQFTCDPQDLYRVHQNLEKLGYIIQESRPMYIPHTFAVLSDQQMQAVSWLYDKVQDNPEVVCLFDNIE